MRELVTGSEILLSNREILCLYEKANTFLSTPQGNKVLREMNVMEAVLHGQGGYVDNECTYSADDYQEHPELFSITKFGAALFIVGDGRLFSAQNHQENWNALENQVKEIIPNFEEQFLKNPEEFRPLTGYVAQVKDPSLRLFRKMWNEPCDEETSLALLQRGWLPIQSFIKAYVLTTDNQLHEAPRGFFSYSDFIEKFEKAGTFKDRTWEVSSFRIALPDKLK